MTLQAIEKLFRDYKDKATDDWYYHEGLYNKNNTPSKMSGWKLHIFGATLNDSSTIYIKIQGFLRDYNDYIMTKFATGSNIKAGIGNRSNNQFGKCVTIYLLPKLFKDNKQQKLIADLIVALYGYNQVGVISGDKRINYQIYYRYDLNRPPTPQEKDGIDYSLASSRSLRRDNDGKHNIDEEKNPDPFKSVHKI